MIRLAISGIGAIAERAHLPAFLALPAVEIVALQSRTIEKAQRVASSLFAPAKSAPPLYTDFERMLSETRPDAVGIFAPNALHCEFTLKALAAGAHVLVEKPMAPSVAQAEQMVAAAARAGKVLMVAMQRRYGGLARAITRALDAGAIGVPHFIRARLSHGGPQTWAPGQQWFFDRAAAGGGAMLDLGVHVADLARWYLGEVATVSGRVAALAGNGEVEDNGAMLLEFRSGAIGVIEASWTSRPPLSAIEIHGSEGRIMAGYPRLDIAVLDAGGAPIAGFERATILSRFDPADWLAPSRELAKGFVSAVEGREAPMPDGIDGLRAVEMIEACYRSSQSGAAVALRPARG